MKNTPFNASNRINPLAANSSPVCKVSAKSQKKPRDSKYPLVSKHVIRNEMNISFSTLKDWRLGRGGRPPRLIKGIHWLGVGSRKIIYNMELIRDFLHNQDNWDLHEKAISNYLESLPSSQARE